ncbi:hypothetical protein DRP77_13515, partial [Candidatus Poribacteria bacterium]
GWRVGAGEAEVTSTFWIFCGHAWADVELQVKGGEGVKVAVGLPRMAEMRRDGKDGYMLSWGEDGRGWAVMFPPDALVKFLDLGGNQIALLSPDIHGRLEYQILSREGMGSAEEFEAAVKLTLKSIVNPPEVKILPGKGRRGGKR